MLIVTRKKGESILIGDDIEVSISKIEDGSVKIAISAPKDVTILRKEVHDRIKEENKQALNKNIDILEFFKK